MTGLQPAAVAARVEERLAPLERAAYLAEWDLAAEASDAHEAAASAASLALQEALGDPALLADVVAAAPGARDPLDARRLEVLRLALAAAQRPPELAAAIVELETRLAGMFSAHRAVVRGEELPDVEVDRILLEERDLALREETWHAARSVAATVHEPLRELVRLRNEAARALGHRDHYALSIASEELDEAWLLDLLDRLHAGLAPAWAAERAAIDRDVRVRLGLPDDGAPLPPWAYADRFFQEAPPLAGDPLLGAAPAIDQLAAVRRYFADLGEDVEPILARSDLDPRAGKQQHAFQITIDRGRDVRTQCNMAPSLRSLETLLHELGHAVYDDDVDPSLPWALRTHAHILVTEASAMLHGRRGRDAAFLERYAGVDPAVARDPANAATHRRGLLVFAAWVQVMARFERALYADPEQDLAAVWWDLVERYQGIARPARVAPSDWAAKIHLCIAPVYYHDYLLGEILASQLESAIEAETGARSPAVDPAAAGRLLRERMYVPGARLRWDALVEHVTGRPLGVEAFVAEVAGG